MYDPTGAALEKDIALQKEIIDTGNMGIERAPEWGCESFIPIFERWLVDAKDKLARLQTSLAEHDAMRESIAKDEARDAVRPL